MDSSGIIRTEGLCALRAVEPVLALAVESMMQLRDWFTSGGDIEGLARPEMDPLTENGALQEAQLVEAHLDAVAHRLVLLFDLRQALQLRTENTALIVFDDVEEFSWAGERRSTRRTAWTIVESISHTDFGEFRLSLAPNGELRVRAGKAIFVSGDVPGLPEAPPDFVEGSDAEVAAGMPSIESRFEPRRASERAVELDSAGG